MTDGILSGELFIKVFAGLLMVIIIGLAIENLIFASIERRIIRRWGMQVGH